MRVLAGIVKNPLSLWLFWVIQKNYLEIKYRKKNIRLGYLTNIRNSSFEGNNQLYDKVRLWHSSIGEYSYIAKNSQISRTQIGKFCSIGPNVMMGLGMHPTRSFVSTHPAFYSIFKQIPVTFASTNLFCEHKKIQIGNDVWIGANVIIADGIRIGNGAIVAAGAVVTKDINAYEIVGGIPAKLIRNRFTAKQIEFLQKYKWWDKNIEWYYENVEFMSDIDILMSKYSDTYPE